MTRTLILTLTAALATSGLAACTGQDLAYKPKEAYTGEKPNLPSVPTVSMPIIKNGDDYTVEGAAYSLRSPVHKASVIGKDISIVGWIVKTNLLDAPECAVHRTGKADEKDDEECKAPLPAFWIADAKDGDEKDAIKVMGFASNFANLFDAIKKYKGKRGTEAEPLMDAFFAKPIPNPIVNVGAQVRVKGNYSTIFTRASSGAGADPIMGQLSYDELEYLVPPPEPGTLPGMN